MRKMEPVEMLARIRGTLGFDEAERRIESVRSVDRLDLYSAIRAVFNSLEN